MTNNTNPIPPVSHQGDMWLLGSHRLLCGDAANVDDVLKLMADDKVNLVFTDPPYNVNYRGRKRTRKVIQNDCMPEAAFQTFLSNAFYLCHCVMQDNASLYVCHAHASQYAFHNGLEYAGFNIRTQIIWVKNHYSLGFGRIHYQHEPIFYCHKKKKVDKWYGDRKQSTVWNIPKPQRNKLHSTMKPVALIEKALINSSQEGDKVLDPFAGSGSTLIACERLGRQAYLMEIDPQYVEVIIKRWQAETGKDAVLASTGESFFAVAMTRGKFSSLLKKENPTSLLRQG